MMQQWEEYICCKCDTNFQINEFGSRCGMIEDFDDMDETECSGTYIHNVSCPVCGGEEFIIAFMSHRMPKRSCAYRDGVRPGFEPNPCNIEDYVDLVV